MSATHVHATLVAIDGRGVLVRGASGSGKSSLALSLLRRGEASNREIRLVADDQVLVEKRGEGVFGRAPEAIRGLLEVRGIGIVPQPFLKEAAITLVVDLCERATIERLPEPENTEIAGVMLRRIRLPERDPGFGADVLLTVLAPLRE